MTYEEKQAQAIQQNLLWRLLTLEEERRQYRQAIIQYTMAPPPMPEQLRQESLKLFSQALNAISEKLIIEKATYAAKTENVPKN